ncbi:cytochrome-c oxidase, cbb3-type subunit III [Hyphomicrobium sp. D-2]|uniref:cytochrome-c oxidase, cbb3-type subunit III n=1 Tax=Hyphomicrobium sp. D-2 TaxID=3041621 RepID=UPI0024570331|nr:cytochrome-c oxidase, cbb3-type subunit III [Hyphomicrobium sp. D-2]MDH4982393.1 cytochrome-c oxidase, cbb3-type subunit III [Hyphomicrobium sp. D-2]
MASERRYDPVTGQYTTGHQWDGIEELSTPLPRWWVISLVVCFIIAIIYAFLYPAWPTTKTYYTGLLGWTSHSELAEYQTEARAGQAHWREQIAANTVGDIAASDDLRTFAVAGGKALFNENCAGCHGIGAGGQQGQFPSLIDDDWLWGGTLDDIYQTVTHGIRNTDESSRQSEMPSFKDMMSEEEIAATAKFVLAMSDTSVSAETRNAMPGAELYTNNCAGCHGAEGEGMRMMGVPALADQIWLYGETEEAIRNQIVRPKMGSMPAWGGRLGDDAVKMLSVYVHSLGGGEK